VPTAKSDATAAFYRRFTLPEERKNRAARALEWSGDYRWFASANVTKLEDYRPPGEAGRIVALLRQRKQDGAARAIARILAEAKRKGGEAT